MAGFFGLFGGNKNKAPQSKEAFFLNEDDAKSFGDIDFMRKEVVIRRTFAKKKGAEEMESVKSISSSASKKVGEGVNATTSSFNTPAFGKSSPAPSADAGTPASTPKAPVVSGKTDTSMDMFRNMAKKIRK